MDSRTQALLTEVVVGLAAGLVATSITDLAQAPLSWLTPAKVDRQEKRVRPDSSSSMVAAKELAGYLDRSVSSKQLAWLGKAIHYSVGITWGPVYGLLRRYGGLRPFSAGLTAGAAMSLILDVGVVPALGLSAPNRDYPVFTHVRGFLAHLVYGAAVALVAEQLGRRRGGGFGLADKRSSDGSHRILSVST